MNKKETVLTCVYCGQAYPAGTPASGADVRVLTDHIRVCPKHPLRKAEAKIRKLRGCVYDLLKIADEEKPKIIARARRILAETA